MPRAAHPALGTPPPLLADDGLQLRVIDDDSESSRHSGGTLSEGLAPGQSNPAAVFLCRGAEGGFETTIAPIPHHNPWSHVAEDFTAVGSPVDDDAVPHRLPPTGRRR